MFAPRRLEAELPVFSLRIPARLFSPNAAFEWLEDQDRARLSALGSARRKAQFACGRWLLHHAARELTGNQRYRVTVPGGRPHLELPDSAAAASLSHSGSLVLCALGRVAAIGVDVEEMRPRRNWEGLARRVLHPSELRGLAGLPAADQWRGFYLAWTRKESLAKALGMGLQLPFSRIRFSAHGSLEEGKDIPGLDRGGWRAVTLEAAPGMAAALAWRAD
jgi:4'-phosphopantetheinyl transferase